MDNIETHGIQQALLNDDSFEYLSETAPDNKERILSTRIHNIYVFQQLRWLDNSNTEQSQIEQK